MTIKNSNLRYLIRPALYCKRDYYEKLLEKYRALIEECDTKEWTEEDVERLVDSDWPSKHKPSKSLMKYVARVYKSLFS